MFIYVFSGFLIKILLCSCQLTDLHAKTENCKILNKNDAEHNCGGQQGIKLCLALWASRTCFPDQSNVFDIEMESISFAGDARA
jgi:hypothetical protein